MSCVMAADPQIMTFVYAVMSLARILPDVAGSDLPGMDRISLRPIGGRKAL